MKTKHPLPTGVTTAQTTPWQALRNRFAGRLANAMLGMATEEYRSFLRNAIRYSLEAARQAAEPDPPSPLGFECTECGAEPGQSCQNGNPRAVGYHEARYVAAGWPADDDEDPDEGSGTHDGSTRPEEEV